MPFLETYCCMLWLWKPGAGVLPGLCISASKDLVSSFCPFLKFICTPEISFLMLACSCYIAAVGAPMVDIAFPKLFALLISSFRLLLNNEECADYWAPPPFCLLILGEIPAELCDTLPPPFKLAFKLLNFYYSIILYIAVVPPVPF